jgi:hypothetical protein
MKKGILALACASALLALPVAANGDTARALGGDNFTIRFTLQTSAGGDPVALKRFRFTKLDAVCNGGATTLQVRGKIRRIEVNDRNRFSETLRRSGKKVRVKGRVRGGGRTVRGTIRASGDFSDANQNCDSGRVRWVARQNG